MATEDQWQCKRGRTVPIHTRHPTPFAQPRPGAGQVTSRTRNTSQAAVRDAARNRRLAETVMTLSNLSLPRAWAAAHLTSTVPDVKGPDRRLHAKRGRRFARAEVSHGDLLGPK